MAHKKAGGSSRNGRDSAGRRLGVKLFGGQAGQPLQVVVARVLSGCGRDHGHEGRGKGECFNRNTHLLLPFLGAVRNSLRPSMVDMW